jgi:hypothetical protein
MGDENTKEEESQKSGVLYSLFHTDGILLNIEKYLKEWFLAKDARFGKVIEAFKIIIPYLHDIQVIRDEQTREYEVHYFEKIIDETGEATGDTQKVSFNELAAGLKSVLAMVGDMFIRLYRTQPTVENPSELVGIAIIDELELHLHPKWQMKLPLLLSTVFPKVQFIASTHSAIPLLGAPSNAIFIKVTRDKEKGIQAEKVTDDYKNMDVVRVLLEYFDTNSVVSNTLQQKIDDYYRQRLLGESAEKLAKLAQELKESYVGLTIPDERYLKYLQFLKEKGIDVFKTPKNAEELSPQDREELGNLLDF